MGSQLRLADTTIDGNISNVAPVQSDFLLMLLFAICRMITIVDE